MLTQAFGPMWARRLFERFLPWYDRDRETVKDAHTEAIRRITIDRGLHFDPALVDAFQQCHPQLDTLREGFRGQHASLVASSGTVGFLRPS